MAIIVPNESERVFLSAGLTTATSLGLFVNNLTPAGSTVLANVTECSDFAYSRQTIAWSTITTDGSGRAETHFSPSGGYDFVLAEDIMGTRSFTVYGWFLTDGTPGSNLIAIEKFGSPVTVTASAITINVPRKTLRLYNP